MTLVDRVSALRNKKSASNNERISSSPLAQSTKGPVVRTIPLPDGSRLQALRQDVYEAALSASKRGSK